MTQQKSPFAHLLLPPQRRSKGIFLLGWFPLRKAPSSPFDEWKGPFMFESRGLPLSFSPETLIVQTPFFFNVERPFLRETTLRCWVFDWFLFQALYFISPLEPASSPSFGIVMIFSSPGQFDLFSPPPLYRSD